MPRSGAALSLEAKVVESLLKVLTDVAVDPVKKAAFDDDPARYLAQHGYEDVDTDHLNEAFSLVADTLPPDVAQSVAGPATATASTTLDADDGSGGAPDTAIHPDEDAFGGVDESFDTAALNGAADDGDDAAGLDADTAGAGDVPDADGGDIGDIDDIDDGNGGYGTGELSLGEPADDGLDDGLDAGDTVAFGVGSEGSAAAGDSDGGGTVPDADHDGVDDAFELTDADTDTTLTDADHDGLDDAFEDASTPFADSGGTVPDADDDGPVDDLSFDDIGSF